MTHITKNESTVSKSTSRNKWVALKLCDSYILLQKQ